VICFTSSVEVKATINDHEERYRLDDLADVIVGFAGQILYRIGLTQVTLQ
jgi:hypothetical protein